MIVPGANRYGRGQNPAGTRPAAARWNRGAETASRRIAASQPVVPVFRGRRRACSTDAVRVPAHRKEIAVPWNIRLVALRTLPDRIGQATGNAWIQQGPPAR